jgi:hypothetical protein
MGFEVKSYKEVIEEVKNKRRIEYESKKSIVLKHMCGDIEVLLERDPQEKIFSFEMDAILDTMPITDDITEFNGVKFKDIKDAFEGKGWEVSLYAKRAGSTTHRPCIKIKAMD